MTSKQRVLAAFPEALLLSAGNDRFEAYVTIHGEFQTGEHAAWDSLAKKIGEDRLLRLQETQP